MSVPEQSGLGAFNPAMRLTLAGFFVAGVLNALVGPVVMAWRHYLESSYDILTNYFLAINAGMLLSLVIDRKLMANRSLSFLLIFASVLSAVSLFVLAGVGPPVDPIWRYSGLVATGTGAAILNAGLFRAISPLYRRDPAAAVNLFGLLFGLGCLTAAMLVAGVFFAYSTPVILVVLGLIPAIFATQFARVKLDKEQRRSPVPFTQAVHDFRSPAAILFALLLFFQFGNEWAIAGWLPIFLAQRLGMSPDKALFMLAYFWFALLVGRFAAQAVLPRVHHGKLLMCSVLAAMLGCLILSFTDNTFGVVTALTMTGGGFSVIYPLVVEKIGGRFPYYHPGLFNGLFSLGVTGGLLAPASLGFFADRLGIRIVMVLPLLGSVMVCILLLLILLEARLTEPSSKA